MKVLVLSEHDVAELLTMQECITVMEDALAALARGEVHNPLRQAIRAPGAPGLLGLMPAWRKSAAGPAWYGLKEVCVFPRIRRAGSTLISAWSSCIAARPGRRWPSSTRRL